MKARSAAESSRSTPERRPRPETVVSGIGLRAGLAVRRASLWRRASSISFVRDWPVSWAKRLADLRSWSSRRIVVRICQSICLWHQCVNRELRLLISYREQFAGPTITNTDTRLGLENKRLS